MDGEIPLRRTDDLIYEYACHEANYGMTNLLQGARAVERDAATGNRTSSGSRQPRATLESGVRVAGLTGGKV